ncbi:Multiple epidermal growth factor-like domains protein 8 [Mortierella sp. GBA30]|nr:Multiple epidermal growth factor-like domains protein 8 [Mortierella sp. GBA30]
MCNSDSPQALGPGWNGTFASNSPDGMYPSQTRTCLWNIQAMTSGSRDPTYVVAINFSTPIQLICGTDELTLYDGPDTSFPRIAVICGNIWQGSLPTYYSTGPQLTAVFSSQERSPGSFGFTAVWTSVDAALSKDFSARSQHAMVYDPSKDMVYIMGGTSLRSSLFWDTITYDFGMFFSGQFRCLCEKERDGENDSLTVLFIFISGLWSGANKWSRIDINTKKPDPRYGHFAFMYNSDIYIYGGVTAIGGLADLWKLSVSSKAWTQLQPINPEKLPAGRAGAACVVVTTNNSTRLYVFGGLNSAGEVTRDMNVYDIGLAMWKKLDHQNSIGLSGATAIYHKATDSIYYFGGMINPTTRNVLTYQYRISQDLWYALAPRADPFTTSPAPYWNISQPDPSSTLNSTDGESGQSGDDSDPGSFQNSTSQYLPPVMYDQVTAVWSPAALMGDDSVVIYSGMRPYGPGVNERDQTCYVKGFAIYDLSCQKWTTYNPPELDAVLKGRANHTMILRPPGASGGSKAAWTAYIFGGFDGTDLADMVNVTLNTPLTTPDVVNNCRALRWCSLYDDCQNCNLNYCSYVNGLCLFDTDKTKNSAYLLGTSADVPKTGTVQDLVRQRPEFKQQVQSFERCPTRIPLDLGNPYPGTIAAAQEMAFKIYVDAHDLNIRYEIRTYPSLMLNFKSLNVWEGFMNMYWRADHGLTDGTWDGQSGTSSPIPSDIPNSPDDSLSVGDGPVIVPPGIMNTSELMNRWTKYSGLDGSSTSSALRRNTSYIYFPANDPRRFSGYYVFSLTNPNPTTISFSLTVTLMDHPTPVDKPTGTPFNMATLGFFMLGFILAVVLLIFMARKIRQLIEDRDAAHRAAEMQLLEDEDDVRNRNGRGNGGSAAMAGMGGALFKKPMYRVVVGVQNKGQSDTLGLSASNLRHRSVRGDGPIAKGGLQGGQTNRDSYTDGLDSSSRPQSGSNIVQAKETTDAAAQLNSTMKRPRVRSDYIRDIGSAPLLLPVSADDMSETGSTLLNRSLSAGDKRQSTSSVRSHAGRSMTEPLLQHHSIPTSNKTSGDDPKDKNKGASDSTTDGNSTTGLQRGWSLKGLGRSTSLKRLHSISSKISPEERKGLTSVDAVEEESFESRTSSRCYDSEQEMVDLSVLPAQTDLLQIRQEQQEKQRQQAEEEEASAAAAGALNIRRHNPVKVQPISVEPLPFHAGLVPRTMAHFRRYQRCLAKQQRRKQFAQLQQPSHYPLEGIQSSTMTRMRTGLVVQSRSSMKASNSNVSSMRSTRSSRGRPAILQPSTGASSASSASVSAFVSQHVPSKQVRSTQSQGSLREIHKKASRMTLRTNGDALPQKSGVAVPMSAVELRPEPWCGRGEDSDAGIELRQLAASKSMDNSENAQQLQSPGLAETIPKRKSIKMRGRQEYEPGPLLAMNILIVFPGDAGSRRVHQQGESWRQKTERHTQAGEETDKGEEDEGAERNDTLYNTEKRLPPMAIGTVFVPDPVRWWAYKAKQQLDRQQFERQMRGRMLKHKQQQQGPLRPLPAKTR